MPTNKLLILVLACCVFLSVAGCQPAKPPTQAAAPPPSVPPPAWWGLLEYTEYVVEKGDVGYWGIAEKVYGQGNGSQWVRIAKANPDVGVNALRPGMKLKIPPLPTPAIPAAPPWSAPGTGTTPGGKLPYEVTPLGGRIYPQTQKANP